MRKVSKKSLTLYIYTLTIIAIIILINLEPISASPGNTDSNGGHTCYTNCEKYGLEYGEYHYHNGGEGTTPSTSRESQSFSNNQNNDELHDKIEEKDDIIAEKNALINE